MLEKIGLPSKPSLRGSTWVVDASHCQGCSSQFTFINRKHHCRRCGGLFCNSCTQQRMVLRGQGDSPVRICDPCKKLEEAARFELRHGYKNRAAKGSSKMMAKHEDDVLSEILGTDGDTFSSSESTSSMDRISFKPKTSSSASFSNVTETTGNDGIELQLETGSASPEELRQKALEEKKKYRILKGEGKSEEALRAFKRGKEIERQAEALEMSIRKNRKRVLSLGNVADVQSKVAAKETSKTHKPPHQGRKEKDDFAAELKDLGWTDDYDKKPASLSLEGELSSLLREVPSRTSQEKGSGIDKTQVIALKKKALMLKREGNLAEAKEELKRAKVLERQLEEQELLAGAEDSDDELSAIISNMDDDEEDDLLGQYEQSRDLDIGNLLGNVEHLGGDGDLDVTDDEMVDPEIAAALKSLGWTEDCRQSDGGLPQPTPSNREGCLAKIQSLKREALNLKREGNVAEAMATLKKAKLLEKELEASNMPPKTVDMARGNSYDQRDLGSKLAPKSRLAIQKELLAVKKKALALRREGRFDEAEEELKKGTVLQNQLDELDNSSKAAAVIAGHQNKDLVNDQPDISGKSLDDDRKVDVTDQDLNDPKYLSLLRSLGWNDEDNKPPGTSSEASNQGGFQRKAVEAQDAKDILGMVPRKSKIEIQRELLGLKRKALALRRQGNADEAEEVLKQTKALEDQIAEIDSGMNLQDDQNQLKKKSTDSAVHTKVDQADDDVTEKDMKDPAFLTVLKNLGWEDEKPTPLPLHERPLKQAPGGSMQYSGPSIAAKTKGQIQRELLDLKRKALALRRQGETGEAEELLRKAHALEVQMEELEAPKSEPMLDASRAGSSLENVSLVDCGNHRNGISEVGASKVSIMHDASSDMKLETKGSVPPGNSPNCMDVDLLADFGRKEAKTDYWFPGNDNSSIPSTSQLAQDNYPLLGEFNPSDEGGNPGKHVIVGSGIASQPGQHGSMVDLLTGDYGEGSQMPSGKGKDESESDFGALSLTKPLSQTGSSASPEREVQSNDNTEQRALHGDLKSDNHDASSVQNVSPSHSQHSLRQEILAYKRKAVALKREGKLIEAKDALRQAKLLEKSLDGDNSPPNKLGPDDPVSTTQASSSGQKENSPSSSASKSLSGRDRFKLQQESLSHKRQALKLRREGRLQEAEAEFEMAKALEVQLEESTSHESSKSELVDDVVVEDLLDPQLLSALKAIGLDDAIGPSSSPEKLVPAKTSPEASKSNTAKESPSQERVQLEQCIKTEKVKAVTLKRAGKQAEALDALRRAKLYEKKLNALASSR